MYGLVVVGTSWGGLNALSSLVAGLPADFPVPVVAVQHRGRESPSFLCELLQRHTPLKVLEANDKQATLPGHVYLAPTDYHLLVEAGFFSLSTDEPVRFSRPSIDVTFTSAADALGPRAIGVVLTGANNDGAVGLRRIVDRGGQAIVQDPATAESPSMPRAALALVKQATVLPLAGIAPALVRLAGHPAAVAGKTR